MLKHRSSGALYFFVHLSYKADVISSDSPCSRKAVWIQVFRTQISCAVHHCFKRRQGLWSVQLLIFWGCLNTHNMDQKNILDQRTLDHLLWHRRDGRWDFQAHSSLQWKSRAFGLNFCPPLYSSMYLLQSSHLQLCTLQTSCRPTRIRVHHCYLLRLSQALIPVPDTFLQQLGSGICLQVDVYNRALWGNWFAVCLCLPVAA